MLERGWAVREVATEAERARASCIREGVVAEPIQLSARVLNACGVLKGHLTGRSPLHPAWTKIPTRFGVELQAYTLGGNISVQYQQITFKGAASPGMLGVVVNELFQDVSEEGLQPLLQLVVTQASVGRCILAKVQCLLERQLEDWAWARVVGRCEELCNNVLFQVRDWDRMLESVGLGGLELPRPLSALVSVTRRGALTLRLTWTGIEWTENQTLIRLTEALARFVHALV